jgi:signal transduction histidine kinase
MGGVLHHLRSLPIRLKVVAMMFGVTAVSLLLVAAGLVLNERAGFERQTERKLTLLADVIGLNSTAALVFSDAPAATETLAALSSDDHVLAAGLYDANGRLFARYLRRGLELSLPNSVPALPQLTFSKGQAELVRPIVLKGQPIGKIYILSDTDEWREALWGFIGIVSVLFIAVLVFGVLASNWLQRIVTDPITDLVQLMRRVATEGDHRLRAEKRADDEMGVLVDGFNTMLDEIGKSRAEIEHAQDELRQLNEELERRVLDRTAQLETANKELEAFSYSVSHDLRAPLRAIDGFSRVLLDEHSAKLDESGRDSLMRVRRAAQRMGILIDDLLKLARVTRAEPVQEEFDFSALAQEVIDMLRGQDPTRDVQVEVMPGLSVNGDSRLLRVALENLLGNAWKFTARQPKPHIEFGAQADNGATTVYYVRDNGAGFDMAYANKLFGAFQRLHTAEEFPGTGIGLATVHRIVRKHGGRIWTESAINQGASFYFTLTQDGPESREHI